MGIESAFISIFNIYKCFSILNLLCKKWGTVGNLKNVKYVIGIENCLKNWLLRIEIFNLSFLIFLNLKENA